MNNSKNRTISFLDIAERWTRFSYKKKIQLIFGLILLVVGIKLIFTKYHDEVGLVLYIYAEYVLSTICFLFMFICAYKQRFVRLGIVLLTMFAGVAAGHLLIDQPFSLLITVTVATLFIIYLTFFGKEATPIFKDCPHCKKTGINSKATVCPYCTRDLK